MDPTSSRLLALAQRSCQDLRHRQEELASILDDAVTLGGEGWLQVVGYFYWETDVPTKRITDATKIPVNRLARELAAYAPVYVCRTCGNPEGFRPQNRASHNRTTPAICAECRQKMAKEAQEQLRERRLADAQEREEARRAILAKFDGACAICREPAVGVFRPGLHADDDPLPLCAECHGRSRRQRMDIVTVATDQPFPSY